MITTEEIKLIGINRELIDIMERLQNCKSEKAKKVYELLDTITDIINEDDVKEQITVLCSGEETVWDSRKNATDYYLEAMSYCEGAERDRYTNIYLQLCEGRTYCTDTE